MQQKRGSHLPNTHYYKCTQNHKHGSNISACAHTVVAPHGFIIPWVQLKQSSDSTLAWIRKSAQSSLIKTQTTSGDWFSSTLKCNITTLIITFPFDASPDILLYVLGANVVFMFCYIFSSVNISSLELEQLNNWSDNWQPRTYLFQNTFKYVDVFLIFKVYSFFTVAKCAQKQPVHIFMPLM